MLDMMALLGAACLGRHGERGRADDCATDRGIDVVEPL